MLTILLGLSGSGKTETICREIRERMAERDNMVLLTPEQQSHRAERLLAGICGPSLSLHAEVLSFQRLYHRTMLELGGLADPIPDSSGRLLLMALAVNELGTRLRRFGDRERRADFLPRLMATAEEFRSALLPPEKLLAASARADGPVGEKLRDLALLLEAWDAVTERQLGDSRDAIARLADSVEHASVGCGGVWVDGFTDFTAAELRVLEALLRRGTDLTVALTLGEGEEERFRVTEGTFRSLMELANRRGISPEIRRLEAPPETPLRYLAENLYTYHAQPITAADAPVELCRMNSFPEECRRAAFRIRSLLRADGTLRCRDIAVAVPELGQRRTVIEAAFREYGIPCFSEETDTILDKGLTVCVTEALAAVTEGWRFRNVLRCLKTGYAGLTPAETDEVENYCITWDIRGEAGWCGRDWSRSPDGYGKPNERAQQMLERLNSLRRRVSQPLGALAEALREPRPVREQLRALYTWLTEIGAAETLRAEAKTFEAAGDRAGANALAQLWSALMDSFTQMETVIGGVTLSAAEFRRLLELLLGQRKTGAIPAALDCVSLGTPARLRGRKMRVLFVLGADDESLPARPTQSGLFSAEERRAFSGLGLPGLRAEDEDVCRPLLELYTLTASVSEKLIVSFTGSEESRPSLLIRRAQTLLGTPLQTAALLRGEHLTGTPETCLRLAMQGGGPWAEAAERVLPPELLEDVRTRAKQTRFRLSPAAVRGLYGGRFRLTASRAETYFQCSYLYFMQYGLEAKERKFAGFSAPESGTFLHDLLEHVCRDVKAAGGFQQVTEETLRHLTQQYAAAFAAEFFRPEQLEDARFRYLFERLCRTAETIVLEIAGELKAGSFEPLDFELKFGEAAADPLPAVEVGDVCLRGTVDRVDGWLDGDRLYLCIADYKTGKKHFSLSDVRYGVSLQMLIYLFMLEESGEAYYGKPVVPAGVLYAPARDELLHLPRTASPEKAAEERAKKLRRTGLLLADERLLQARENGTVPRYIPVQYKDGVPVGSIATAAQLGELAVYVKKLIAQMGAQLRAGDASAAPLFDRPGGYGPCSFCPYGSVCAFDAEREPVRVKENLKDSEFWETIGEELNHG